MSESSLTLVVPCYNEEDIFPFCLSELKRLLQVLIAQQIISTESHILFIDDGSLDKTWQLIEEAARDSSFIHGIKLSRNYGHQIALLSGLSCADTDMTISIDADLQDDITVIPEMIKKYHDGNDIIYGVRADRTSDNFFKRFTANGFYKFMDFMGVQQISNHADFRLLSRCALDCLLKYEEQNIYLRGMIPLLGFKSDKVFYARKKRSAGESKYPFHKMLALAINGITSFSIRPLRLISVLGGLTCVLSVFLSFYVIIQRFYGSHIIGWASLEISIVFLGGVQLLSLGVIGEYVGKIYLETKHRPKFFIQDRTKI